LDVTVGKLASLLSKRSIRPCKSGIGFSLVQLSEGGKRCNADVLHRSGIECDIDTGATYADVEAKLSPYTHLAYSTHGHDPENGRTKFRIVMPFSRDVLPSEWGAVWKGANQLLGNVLDPSTKDISRMMFFPSCPSQTKDQAFFYSRVGSLLDPDYLVDLASGESNGNNAVEKIALPPESVEEIDRVTAMLEAISADCPYKIWRQVLWAMKSTGWTIAEKIAREWSQTAPMRFDEEAFQKVWASYDPARTDAVRFGTLVYLARQHGWMPSTNTADLASAEPGDIVAGRVYAASSRNRLRWVGHAGRWIHWNGTRWEWAVLGEHMVLAKEVADWILSEASHLFAKTGGQSNKLMKFAMALQSLSRLEAMVELAKSETGVTVGHLSDLDSNPWLLGVRNGVVDLKSGVLLAPDPAMLITRQVAADYDREAQCPCWLTFLDEIFQDDKDTIEFVQRALGYTLTGITTEEVLFICYGHGANGKSVFANVIGSILGDYGQTAPPSLLTVRRDGDAGPRNDIARLCGARLVQINELNQGDRLDEQVVKMLAGREVLSARFLHKEFFDFWPTAKPWLRTNHRPVVVGEDDGIWRRLMLIPFLRKIPEGSRDRWLESRLMAERNGILAWLVQGCLDWQRDGLKPSPLVRRESAAYRKDSDLLGEFLDERVTYDPNAKIEQSVLFQRYKGWNEANGTRYGSKAAFTRKLAERGYADSKSNGKRYYLGLRLAEGVG
jgi:putative DNA primase/helicase